MKWFDDLRYFLRSSFFLFLYGLKNEYLVFIEMLVKKLDNRQKK